MKYKRVERLCRPEGQTVRRRERKRLAVPHVPQSSGARPERRMGIECVSDTLASGQCILSLTVVDVCTQESLALVAAHSLLSITVIEVLVRVNDQRGAPVRLSLDNGAAFRSRTFNAWAAGTHIELRFIQTAKPI